MAMMAMMMTAVSSFLVKTDGAAESESDPVRDRKFIVFEENLNELLERCRRCGEVSHGTHGQICWSKFAVYANG